MSGASDVFFTMDRSAALACGWRLGKAHLPRVAAALQPRSRSYAGAVVVGAAPLQVEQVSGCIYPVDAAVLLAIDRGWAEGWDECSVQQNAAHYFLTPLSSSELLAYIRRSDLSGTSVLDN